ncbi:MAG: PTS sugar transporter subunit IIC [Culicoidibacterales bacterium]
MTMKTEKKSISDIFATIAQTIGGEIHLRTLRDAFASIMPFMILAGFVTLINYVVLDPKGFLSVLIAPEILTEMQTVGSAIANGTLSIISLLIIVSISYHMCVNKNDKNIVASTLVSISTFMVLTPMLLKYTPEGATESFTIMGVLPLQAIGSSGMFVAIFVGLFATELFIFFSNNKRLQIKIDGNIPPSVIGSFTVLFPIILTILCFAIGGFILNTITGLTLSEVISLIIVTPLKGVTTSLPGFLLITSIANLFFGFGIHQAVISGALLDPFLIQNMQENMLAYANNQQIPHIINMAFKDTFAVMGGSGNTISLLIAIFIFSRRQDYKDIAKLSLTPSIFNISEPIIFGLPIVFNISLIIPFVLAPIISLTIAYFATVLGLINHVVVQTPWTTPPLISGFLATGGDFRAAILQLLLIVGTVFLYLPFLKIDEKVAAKLAQKNQK